MNDPNEHRATEADPVAEAATIAPARALETSPGIEAATFAMTKAGPVAVASGRGHFELGLGQYRQRAVVGHFSHGRIEEAEHSRLACRVVLRILDEAVAREPRMRAEFLRQARVLALLEHPNLATGILEAVGDGPEPYVAFAMFEDRPLDGLGPRDDWLKVRGTEPYDNPRLALLLTDAARGVQALGEAGLVHGHLRIGCLRVAPLSGRLRIHELWWMPLIQDDRDGKPTNHDLADVAEAFARAISAGAVGERDTVSSLFADTLMQSNAGLRPEIACLLARCVSASPSERLDQPRELIAKLDPLANTRVTLAGPFDRGIALVLEFVISSLAVALAFALGGAWAIAISERIQHHVGTTLDIDMVMLGLWMATITLMCEVLCGTSAGRRLRGLRLIGVAGRRPSRRAIAARAILEYWSIVGLVALAIGGARLTDRQLSIVTSNQVRLQMHPLIGVLLLVPFATSLFTRSRRPLYDVVTGVTWGKWQPVEPRSTADLKPVGAPSPPRDGRGQATDASERIGRNRLERELGRGGMGAVFAAWDEVLDRPVAVKLITGASEASPEVIARFEREARLAAQVRHENVAQVFGVGQDGNRPFMVLELLRGRTLQQVVEERGPLPLADAWSYTLQAARGLEAANRLGIIHRDIKPSNLMLTEDGVVKVLDFGISKLVADTDDREQTDLVAEADRLRADPMWRDACLTRTGALMGTPLYMSPEQANSRPLDCRTDIYSLGLTLYYMLSGRPPFQAGDTLDLLLMQCESPPPRLEESVANLTPERAAVLERMVAKRPSDRFQDYDDLFRALDRTAPRPPERARVDPRLCAALMDLALAAALEGLFHRLIPRVYDGDLTGLLLDNLRLIVTAITIWRWGSTPAKWLFGQRVTRLDGRSVSLARSILRQFLYQPALLLAANWLRLSAILHFSQAGVESAEFLIALTFDVVWTAISVYLMTRPNRQAIHDLAADTIVIALPDSPGSRLLRWRPFRKGPAAKDQGARD